MLLTRGNHHSTAAASGEGGGLSGVPPPASLHSLLVRAAGSAPNGEEAGVGSRNGQGEADGGQELGSLREIASRGGRREEAEQWREDQERRRDNAMRALMQEQLALKLKVDQLLVEKTKTNAKIDGILQLLQGERRLSTDSFPRGAPHHTDGVASLPKESAVSVKSLSFGRARTAFSPLDSPRKRRSRSCLPEHASTLVVEQGVGPFILQVSLMSPTLTGKVSHNRQKSAYTN